MAEVRKLNFTVEGNAGTVPYILLKDTKTEGDENFVASIRDQFGNVVATANLTILDTSLNPLSISMNAMSGNRAKAIYANPVSGDMVEGLLLVTETGLVLTDDIYEIPGGIWRVAPTGNAILSYLPNGDWVPRLADGNGKINVLCTSDVPLTSSEGSMYLQRIAPNGDYYIVQTWGASSYPKFSFYAKTGATSYTKRASSGTLYPLALYSAIDSVEISPDGTRIACALRRTGPSINICTADNNGYTVGTLFDLVTGAEKIASGASNLLWLGTTHLAVIIPLLNAGGTKIGIYAVDQAGVATLGYSGNIPGQLSVDSYTSQVVKPTPLIADSYRFIGGVDAGLAVVDITLAGVTTANVIPMVDSIPITSAVLTPSGERVIAVDQDNVEYVYQININGTMTLIP